MSKGLDDIITEHVTNIVKNQNYNNQHTSHTKEPEPPIDTRRTSYRDDLLKYISEINQQIAENKVSDKEITYKYAEDKIVKEFSDYLANTYREHYKTDSKNEQSIECFDAWIALGDSMPTFRNTAIKYLWRYGKKGGSNKKDLFKVLHYTLMMLYVDHYKDSK